MWLERTLKSSVFNALFAVVIVTSFTAFTAQGALISLDAGNGTSPVYTSPEGVEFLKIIQPSLSGIGTTYRSVTDPVSGVSATIGAMNPDTLAVLTGNQLTATDSAGAPLTNVTPVHPLADLLRDFNRTTDSSEMGITVTIANLAPSSQFVVTGWSYTRSTSSIFNTPPSTGWFQVIDNTKIHLATILMDYDDPSAATATFTVNSDDQGQILLLLHSTYEDGGVALFNGLVLVPEPGSLALLGIGSVLMFRRARRKF